MYIMSKDPAIKKIAAEIYYTIADCFDCNQLELQPGTYRSCNNIPDITIHFSNDSDKIITGYHLPESLERDIFWNLMGEYNGHINQYMFKELLRMVNQLFKDAPVPDGDGI